MGLQTAAEEYKSNAFARKLGIDFCHVLSCHFTLAQTSFTLGNTNRIKARMFSTDIEHKEFIYDQ